VTLDPTDGDGWTRCDLGHEHWGRFGAAGLLLHTVDDDGQARVLMQHRSELSHHGGTWGIPGGARASREDAVAAACREAAEEAGIDASRLRVRRVHVDDHGGWTYQTVVADTPEPLPTVANAESLDLTWQPIADVAALDLHPGFAATWPLVRARPIALVVDAANVVGTDPFRYLAQGWWHDRARATTAFLADLGRLRARTTRSPSGEPVVVRRVHVVVEGKARGAVGTAPGWLEVHAASGSGDDTVVTVAEADSDAWVVTADAGLRRRLPADVEVVGPRWLLAEVDADASGAAAVKAVTPSTDP